MAPTHDAKRVTEDVDSHIRRRRDAVTRVVAEIADEHSVTGNHIDHHAVRGRRQQGTHPFDSHRSL